MTTHDLHPAAEAMATLVTGIDGTALDAATPCPDLTVGDLLDHLASFCDAFTVIAQGQPGKGVAPDGANLPPDWRAEILARLRRLADAWGEPSAWDGERNVAGMDLPAQVAGLIALDELVLHGWDLAVATDQRYEPRAEDVAAATGFVESFDAPRDGSLFGPPVSVPDDAPALDRLLGFAGRDPGWHRP